MFEDTAFPTRIPYLCHKCSIKLALTARFLAMSHVPRQTFQHALSMIWICCFHYSVSRQNMQVNEVERDHTVDLPQWISPTDRNRQSPTLQTLEQRPSNI